MSNNGKMDKIAEQLSHLKSDLPEPKPNLSLQEKIELIKAAGGPRTVESILKAKKDFPLERIPWLFNSIDSQIIIDILNNDMQEALNHSFALSRKKTDKAKKK